MRPQQGNVAIIDHVGGKAGMDYYTGSLAQGLVANGVRCSVYSNFSYSVDSGVTYHPYFEGHSTAGAVLKLLRFGRAVIRSACEARLQKADLVVVHLFSANLLTLLLCIAPKMLGLRLAVIAHDIDSFADNDSPIIQNLIYRHLANYIVVHNSHSRDCLMRQGSRISPDKVRVIKHGGHLSFIGEPIDRLAARKELGLEADKKYLLFFGQIKKVKGLDLLLEAMVNLPPDIHLIIAGKPQNGDFSDYQALIERYKLQGRVKTFIRFISDEERKLFFFAADANVLPYRVIYQSGVLLMAMSHGLPVIASDLPANREIIRHGKNGLLFASGNPESLAQCIDDFFSDSNLSGQLGNAAINTIETEYDWKKIAVNYLGLLK